MHGFRWNDWNVDHIANHGVSPGEAEFVLDHARSPYPENIGQKKWRVRGPTAGGRLLQVIFLLDPDNSAYIIHARDLNATEKRQMRRRIR